MQQSIFLYSSPNIDIYIYNLSIISISKLEVERLTPTEDLKEVQIGPSDHQVTKIGTPLIEDEKQELVNRYIKNVDLFTLAPSNIHGIDTKVVSHHLAIDPSSKPVAHRKWKVDEEKMVTIDKEVSKLSDIRFIKEKN